MPLHLGPCAYLVSNKSCRCRPCERISQFGQAINALVNVCIRTRTGKCQHKYNPNAFELKMKRPRRPHQIQQSAWEYARVSGYLMRRANY